MTDNQFKLNQLRQYQAMPLGAKIRLSEVRIREWLEHWDGKCYVAFSGGKDSTVLLDLVWSIDPTIPAVFVDTGLEYPEIREFVKGYGDRVVWLKPKMRFDKVIEKYGYPVISKNQAHYIEQVRSLIKRNLQNSATYILRIFGIKKNGEESSSHSRISKKWLPLIDSPFKISPKCCDIMKKEPLNSYAKAEKRTPIIGIMATEGASRNKTIQQKGCNVYDKNKPKSRPISFWTEQDILKYIREKYIKIADIYGDIRHGVLTFQEEQEDGSYRLLGEQRTGCMFCMFGVHMEKGETRFQRMARTHPKQHDYCINKLGCGEVLDFIGVDYNESDCQIDKGHR